MQKDVQDAIQAAAGNVQVKTFSFPWQSFFDSTQLGQALAIQSSNDPIVALTSQSVPSPGFWVGLHPDSQVPVAIRFKSGAGVTDSSPMTLVPGQVVTPHGCAPFSGFDVGLPFGWLGGGAAQIIIGKTPAAQVAWSFSSEVVIQRQRVVIQADGAGPTFSLGLPTGFPWKNALRYNATTPSSPFPQGGSAVVSASPTRTEFKLRLAGGGAFPLAADALLVMLVKNSQAFDTGPGDPPTLSNDVEAVPILIPKTIGTAPYFPTVGVSFPVTGAQLAAAGQGGHSPGVLLAGDDATFCILNQSGNAALTGLFVDIVRYGLI
jgi:hypothetical protein